MRQIQLIILMIIHWVITAIFSFYVYYRWSSSYDWVYFTVVCITIISWTLTGNECIISYWEKLCIEPEYVFNSDPSLPYITLIFGDLCNLIKPFLMASAVYNLFTMMTIYKVPIIIKLTFIYLMLHPMIKFRIEKTLKESTNNINTHIS